MIDGAEHTLWLVDGDGALAAEIGLKVSHQESGGDAFAGDIADDEAEPAVAELEEIVVVAADLARLDAHARVVEASERRKRLREEARLDLLGDFEFLSGTALLLDLFLSRAALLFDGVSDLVETEECEGVAVGVAKARYGAAPDGTLFADDDAFGAGSLRFVVANAVEARSADEANASAGPFADASGDIFRDENDVGGAADEFLLRRIFAGHDKHKESVAFRRRDGHPALAVLESSVKGELEAELIEIEVESAILIANVDIDAMDADVGLSLVRRRSGRREIGRGAAHGGIIAEGGERGTPA